MLPEVLNWGPSKPPQVTGQTCELQKTLFYHCTQGSESLQRPPPGGPSSAPTVWGLLDPSLAAKAGSRPGQHLTNTSHHTHQSPQ